MANMLRSNRIEISDEILQKAQAELLAGTPWRELSMVIQTDTASKSRPEDGMYNYCTMHKKLKDFMKKNNIWDHYELWNNAGNKNKNKPEMAHLIYKVLKLKFYLR